MPSRIDIHGTEIFSVLDSYIFWRNKTTNFLSLKAEFGERFPSKQKFVTKHSEEDKGIICVHCRSIGLRRISPEEQIGYCICELLRMIQNTLIETAPFRSYVKPESKLSKLEIWGVKSKDNPDQEKKQMQSMADAIEFAKEFIRNPYKWLLLMGNPGCGKTHILEAIANMFGSYALYMTGSDFENIVFTALQDGTINDVMHILCTAPILLIDDMGTEHGKEFVKSKFREIVHYRYARWPEFPIAITTNNKFMDIYRYDARVASRFSDNEKVNRHLMHVDDYRRHKTVNYA